MNNKEILCKYCQAPVPQGKTKTRYYCNQSCYYKHYAETGKLKVAMDKYCQKPGVKIKNRERAKKWAEIHKKPIPPRFCEVCGTQLSGHQINFCSKECIKDSPRLKAYHKSYGRKNWIKKRKRRLESDLIIWIDKRKEARRIINNQKRVYSRAVKKINEIRKELK